MLFLSYNVSSIMFTNSLKNWWRAFRASRNKCKGSIFIIPLLWGILFILLLLYNYQLHSLKKVVQFIGYSESKYLINSAKCQIPNLDPFNEFALEFFSPERYDPCSKRPLLTYVTKIGNVVTLNVNEKAAPWYSAEKIVCCYTNINRDAGSVEPDDTIRFQECRMFKDTTPLDHDTVYVKCFRREDREVIYENTHATFPINDDVKEKMNRNYQKQPISVLLIGIDTISRLNFIRSLPNTYSYVENNEWIPLKAYNKVADGTFPNLIAMLTGRKINETHDICNPMEVETFDQCPMIWNVYRKLGYVTSYAEDGSLTSTFNYNRKGFSFPPTDFYFRPYIIASETLTTAEKSELPYCAGPETSGERIMNLAKDFAVTFKEHPHFGWFWMNTFSRNQLNSPSGMDDKIKEFLESLSKERVLEHSVVIFFSSTGLRFGNMRMTKIGWLEDRLPFIYVSVPSWFKKTFRTEYKHLVENSVRLTSPYDLHMTLQHFLVLSGHDYKVSPAAACPLCTSLLDKIKQDRPCNEAGIEAHWCACSNYTKISLSEDVTKIISTFVLDHIYKIITSFNDGWMCSRYFVNDIISSSLAISHTNETYLLLKFETVPKAIFEATIVFHGKIKDANVSVSEVSRIDTYMPHNDCVMEDELKKYCYCLR